MRIEFQDGTRKLPTQEYHGSGRPHLPLLVFGDDDLIRTLDLSSAASATMPSDADLAGYVRGSQLDHKQDSGRGIFAEENQYVEELSAWRLKHLPEDQETGLRGYLPDVLVEVSPGPPNWGGQSRNAPPVHDQVLGQILRLSFAGVAERRRGRRQHCNHGAESVSSDGARDGAAIVRRQVSPVALHDAAGRQARLCRAGAGRRVAREARGAALRGGGLGPRAGQFVGLPAQDQRGRPDQRVA